MSDTDEQQTDALTGTDAPGDERISPASVLEATENEASAVLEGAGVAARSSGRTIASIVLASLVVVALAACMALGFAGGSEPSNEGATASKTVEAAPENQEANASANQDQAADPQKAETDSTGDPSASDGSSSSASYQGSAQAGSSPQQSQPPASEKPAPAPEPATITVKVYIDSSRAPGYPSCMASTTVTLNEGASVYEALRATGVSVGGSSSYVRSINGLAEKLPGYEAGSGWMYSVDGSYPNRSCGSYKLSGGESIRWSYTLNMGRDL